MPDLSADTALPLSTHEIELALADLRALASDAAVDALDAHVAGDDR